MIIQTIDTWFFKYPILLLHIIHFSTLKSKFFNNFTTKVKIHYLQKPIFNYCIS